MTMQRCGNCFFWSDMCARSIGCGPVEAVCLSPDGTENGKWKMAKHSCDKWTPIPDDGLGVSDSPGRWARDE